MTTHEKKHERNLKAQNHALELENERLKSMLHSLVSKAEHNEKVQKKFQGLEINLLRTDSLPKLFDTLIHRFKSQFKIEKTGLYLYDPHDRIQELVHEVYPNTPMPNLKFFQTREQIHNLYPNGYKTRLTQKDLYLSEQLFPGHDNKVLSLAQLPLVRHGEIIGSYHLGSENEQRFSPDMSTEFIDHLASIIALCIENTMNLDKLKHLSLIDPLTHTKNRRSLHRWLDIEIARAEREQTALSCLFIDLDHFKQINDKYGHPVGDRVLKMVAETIQPNLRATDILARFGGEEFTVLLPGSDQITAQHIAERIRLMVEQLVIPINNVESCSLSCSIGGTTWYPQLHSASMEEIAETIIQCADLAVYHAKDNGRNCCQWHDFEINKHPSVHH